MSSERPWWIHFVQWAMWGVLMTLVLGWLGRTRNREPERSADAIVLRSPTSTLGLGVSCIGFFMVCAVGALLSLDAGRGLLAFALFTGFAMLGAPLLADYYLDRFEVRDDELVFRTTFGGRGRTSWSDIVEIKYVDGVKWFRLQLRCGRVVRVSIMMVGLPILAQHLLSRATGATLSPRTRTILTDTAGGKPPSVWS